MHMHVTCSAALAEGNLSNHQPVNMSSEDEMSEDVHVNTESETFI